MHLSNILDAACNSHPELFISCFFLQKLSQVTETPLTWIFITTLRSSVASALMHFGIFCLWSLWDGHLIVCKCVWWGVCSCREGNRFWTSKNRSKKSNEKGNLSSKSTLSWAGGWTRSLSEVFPNLNYSDWHIMIMYFILWWESGLLVPSKIHHRFLAWILEKGGLCHYTACV